MMMSIRDGKVPDSRLVYILRYLPIVSNLMKSRLRVHDEGR